MYTRILVVVESASPDNAAVEQALALAREPASELVLLAVVPLVTLPLVDFPIASLDPTDLMRTAEEQKANQALGLARQAAEAAGVRHRVVKVQSQDGAACVVDTAVQLGCEVILVESQGRNSVMRLLDGSLIPGLITLSTLPVLVVPHRGAAVVERPAQSLAEASDARH